MIKAVSRNVAKMEKDWKAHCASIAASEDGSNEKKQMKDKLKLVRSKLENEVGGALLQIEEEMKKLHGKNESAEKKEAKEKENVRVFGEYTKLLHELEEDMKEIFLNDDVSIYPAITIESIVIEDKFSIDPISGGVLGRVALAAKLWKAHCTSIADSGDAQEKKNLKKETQPMRIKTEQEVRMALSEFEKEMQEFHRKNKSVEKKEAQDRENMRVFGEYAILLKQLEEDMKGIFRDYNVSVTPALTIASML